VFKYVDDITMLGECWERGRERTIVILLVTVMQPSFVANTILADQKMLKWQQVAFAVKNKSRGS
jgi:hypothetical protein